MLKAPTVSDEVLIEFQTVAFLVKDLLVVTEIEGATSLVLSPPASPCISAVPLMRRLALVDMLW
jgi:hypothetical protein